MRLGTIGAGTVARAFAAHAIAAAHEVRLSNRRGLDSLSGAIDELGPGALAGTVHEAAREEIVVLAVPWPAIPAALSGLGDWEGRIVVDATNQFETPPPNPQVADLGDQTGSEYVASLMPGARVVKAFNTLYGRYIAADPRHEEGRQLLFLAGDDLDAKARFVALVTEFGFAAVDIGGLRAGGWLMQVGGPLSGLHALTQD